MNQVLPYDPDFDVPPDNPLGGKAPATTSTSIFDALGPRRSFILGFVFSLMLMTSVGFLILAANMLS